MVMLCCFIFLLNFINVRLGALSICLEKPVVPVGKEEYL